MKRCIFGLSKHRFYIFVTIWISVYLLMNYKETLFYGEARHSSGSLHAMTRIPITAAQDIAADPDTDSDEETSEQPKYYDVILNSYMRSGSTLMGIVLGWRKDTFYVYEPLWKTARWTYWHGNDTVCRSDRQQCRKLSQEKSVDGAFVENKNNQAGGSLNLAMKILRRIYDCLFNDFDRTVVHVKVTIRLGGPTWEPANRCIQRGMPERLCIFRATSHKCKEARHKVTKVLRMTVDLLEPFLINRPNMKVIHLFRDPRAIINSRAKTFWYPVKKESDMLENAASLCPKILADYRAGLKLQEKYPDRFKFLYYEDFNSNPAEKMELLYSYLGMSLDEDKYKEVLKLSVFHLNKTATEREKNTAYWWRKTMSLNVVKRIDSICSDVYDALGYVKFTEESNLRNLDIASIKIPDAFVLK